MDEAIKFGLQGVAPTLTKTIGLMAEDLLDGLCTKAPPTQSQYLAQKQLAESSCSTDTTGESKDTSGDASDVMHLLSMLTEEDMTILTQSSHQTSPKEDFLIETISTDGEEST